MGRDTADDMGVGARAVLAFVKFELRELICT